MASDDGFVAATEGKQVAVRLENKVAVITGATRGLGRAWVDGFIAAGHTVAGSGRSRDARIPAVALALILLLSAACGAEPDLPERAGCPTIARTYDRGLGRKN